MLFTGGKVLSTVSSSMAFSYIYTYTYIYIVFPKHHQTCTSRWNWPVNSYIPEVINQTWFNLERELRTTSQLRFQQKENQTSVSEPSEHPIFDTRTAVRQASNSNPPDRRPNGQAWRCSLWWIAPPPGYIQLVCPEDTPILVGCWLFFKRYVASNIYIYIKIHMYV